MSSPVYKSAVTAALGAGLMFLLVLPISIKSMAKLVPRIIEANGALSLEGVAILTVVFFAIAFLMLFSIDRVKKH